MPPETSERRRPGLVATSTERHHFAILAIDHIDSMAEAMRPGHSGEVTRDQIAAAKTVIAGRLRHMASALLLDPESGHGADTGRSEIAYETGLVLGIEDAYSTSAQAAPRLLEGWSVRRAADLGVDAVKISFYFDPDAGTTELERFVAGVVEDCRRCGVPLFAEPLAVVHDPGDRRRLVVEGARRFGALGVDVLKLEFPVDVSEVADPRIWAEACAEVDSASPVPWTLLSAGEDFERFAHMLEVACGAGASGFVVGRAVWRQVVSGGAVDSRRLDGAAARLDRLCRIADERARPWSSHPSHLPVATRGTAGDADPFS